MVGTTSSQSRIDARETKKTPLGELLDRQRGHLERKASLAGPSGARKRHEADVIARQERLQLLEVVDTPDEGVWLDGQVRRPVVERLQRRELGRQPLDVQLIEVL